MIDRCPGAAGLKTPTLSLKTCPNCGEEIEIFSDEMKIACPTCGQVIFNDIVSCISWCKYARECIGEDMYQKYKKK
jgi:transposase